MNELNESKLNPNNLNQNIIAFLELLNNKIDIISQQNQFIYQEINNLKELHKELYNELEHPDHPRKRICLSNRQSNTKYDDVDASTTELKRKNKLQQSPTNLKETLTETIKIHVKEELKEELKDLHDDLLDEKNEKERHKWLQMEELKYRISEIETKHLNKELDQYHLEHQMSYIS
uniref:Uncharacterized protein n=1 Tax=viral metagenome TaxID=1070528 RepID=A0A6C0E7B3_9ZZZZ